MGEYIDRNALQKLFNEVSTSLLGKAELSKDIEHMVRAFLMTTQMIQDAPAADVVPVVHGHWIEQEDGNLDTYYICSACKEDFYLIAGTPCENLYNYCPSCGAKMDEKE